MRSLSRSVQTCGKTTVHFYFSHSENAEVAKFHIPTVQLPYALTFLRIAKFRRRHCDDTHSQLVVSLWNCLGLLVALDPKSEVAKNVAHGFPLAGTGFRKGVSCSVSVVSPHRFHRGISSRIRGDDVMCLSEREMSGQWIAHSPGQRDRGTNLV